MTDPMQREPSETAGDADPAERPGDAAEEAGIVDQQAVAVQSIEEAEADGDGPV
jgi:hypothetical protein